MGEREAEKRERGWRVRERGKEIESGREVFRVVVKIQWREGREGRERERVVIRQS